MRVALKYWSVNKDWLNKADEIIIPYEETKNLMDIIEKYPNKNFIIDIPKGLILDWALTAACEAQLKDGAKIYLRLHDVNNPIILMKIKEANLKFFWNRPVSTFQEAYALKKIGVSHMYLNAPLFFQMDEVKKIGIPIRLIPNHCHPIANIPRENGLHGCWIRPEKLYLYEDYAESIEFYCLNQKQEKALYKVFVEDKKWIGDMNTIFTDFRLSLSNDLVYEGLDEMRLNCGQKCETPKPYCHMCDKVKRFEEKGRKWAEEELERQRELEQEITN